MTSRRVAEVRARKVGKVYGRQRALADIDLTFSAGQLAIVCGGNGAGKSTLLGLLSTRIAPSSGELSFDGRSADAEVRRSIGVIAHQSLCYGDLSGRENLRFFARLYDVEPAEKRAAELLERVGLAVVSERAARTYSRGMLQRLSVARALVHRPSVLLCDEPFSGLDVGGVEQLQTLLAEERAAGTSILCVTHDFAPVAGLCDRLVVLERGRLKLDEAPAQRTTESIVASYRRALTTASGVAA